jgi:hypothetical protein
MFPLSIQGDISERVGESIEAPSNESTLGWIRYFQPAASLKNGCVDVNQRSVLKEGCTHVFGKGILFNLP